ncbi:hypothetical protein KAI87_02935 [Myxococcota bacterium]|nr:hypothetical protein [Myxococcota bacterium]
MPEENGNSNVVDDSMTKVMNKIGITGIASALFTAILGVIIILYPFEWEHLKLIIGLYLLIVGVMNLTGYVISMVDKKDENIYIETETLKTK